MKKLIIVFLLLILSFSFIFGEKNHGRNSQYTNLNEKIAYIFLEGVNSFGWEERLMRTIMVGATSLGFFVGAQITEETKIRQLCYVESAVFLILTPITYLIKTEPEKIFIEVKENKITPLEGLKRWKNYLLMDRIISSLVYIGGGGYLAYKGIEWTKNGEYVKGRYDVMYYLGFTLIAGGIVNLFHKHPDECFYETLKENKLISKKVSNNFYVYNDKLYYEIKYKF